MNVGRSWRFDRRASSGRQVVQTGANALRLIPLTLLEHRKHAVRDPKATDHVDRREDNR